jgi:hypothetical protein
MLASNSITGKIESVTRQRFLRLWALWSALYLVLAVVGPNGLMPVPVWPVVSQHILQVRAWLGEDIVTPEDETEEARLIPVSRRLDVTPYIHHRVVRDPREDSLIANIAAAVPGPHGGLVPLQDVWSGSPAVPPPAGLVCHVAFPPGPAFFLLPLYAVFRGILATQWLSALLGGLAVAAMDRLFAEWSASMGLSKGRPDANALTWLAGAGTLWLWLSSDGGTFLFSQVVGTTSLTIALLLAWREHWWKAGVVFGIALTSRPATIGALPVLLSICALVSVSGEQKLRGLKGKILVSTFLSRSARLLTGPLVLGIIALMLNFRRFGSVWEFGYRFMVVPPFLRERFFEHGQLSFAHLGRNLYHVGIQAPLAIRDAAGDLSFPFLASDPQGMGVLFVTPAFVALVAAVWTNGRARSLLLLSVWISLGLTCLPGLLYYNTGWVQWGGRFLVDGWPLWLLLAALGLCRLPPRVSIALIVLSVISNAWAAILVALRVWPGCCL